MSDQPGATQADEPGLPPDPSPARVFTASVAAVIGKESRWRMRGRRAFVILALYVALVGLFELVAAKVLYDQAFTRFDFEGNVELNPSGMASGSIAASIGQVLFGAVLSIQMVLVMILSPALTSGAVSMEREKQTLELLITTPVSTLGMIVGKLFASLSYVFLLIAASVPLMAVVFVFGGVAPEDVVRAYVLLCVVAIGLGSVGLFFSALTKRTQVATALSLVLVVILTLGTFVGHAYIISSTQRFQRGQFEQGWAPEQMLWLNPVVGVMDVGCTAIPTSPLTCSYVLAVVSPQEDPFLRGNQGDMPRDALWPKIALSFLVLAALLILATTQLIAPSRRLRRRRPPPVLPAQVGAA
jgi:ABC-type transport system involved in multi-copper enzyme maturation permease subunit